MQMNFDALNSAVEELKTLFKDGLLATDIWERELGLSFAGYNQQPAAVALFTETTRSLLSTLKEAGFPGLNRYYMLELEGDHIVMLIRHDDDVLQGILLNSKKVNLGLLLSVALPKMLTSVKKARVG